MTSENKPSIVFLLKKKTTHLTEEVHAINPSYLTVLLCFLASPVHQRAAQTGAGQAERSPEDLGGERQPHQHPSPQRHPGDPEIQEALQLGDTLCCFMG